LKKLFQKYAGECKCMSENDFFICQKKGFYTNSVSQSELNSDAKFLFCPAEENMLINSFFPLYE